MIIYKQYFLIFNIFITVTYQICKVAPKHQKSLKKIAFEGMIWLPKFWDYICKFAYNLYYNTYEIRYWEPEKNRSRLADFVCFIICFTFQCIRWPDSSSTVILSADLERVPLDYLYLSLGREL